MKTLEYFNRAARNYQDKSLGWPWSVIRSFEIKAVNQLLPTTLQNIEILELGCGTGFYTRHLLEKNAKHIYALDFSHEMLNSLPKKNVTGVQVDCADFNLAKQFKWIVSMGLLEFVEQPLAVLRNAFIHAEDRAELLLLIPRSCLLGRLYKLFHRTHGLHIQLYTKEKITTLLFQSGWELECIKRVLPFSYVIKARKSNE